MTDKGLEGSKPPNESREALYKMKMELPLYIEHMTVMATLHKAKFDALKEQGFDDKQALELCKSVF